MRIAQAVCKKFTKAAKRFHLLVAVVVLLVLMFIFWLANIAFEDYVLSLIKEANEAHHWNLYTRLLYITTTYPVRSAAVIAFSTVALSELHLRAKAHPVWKAIFAEGGNRTDADPILKAARSSVESDLELPEIRPKIVPVDYCKAEKAGSWGLHMRNSGHDALDIEIPDVPIGKSGYTLEFPGRLAQLGERSGIGFLEAWLKHEMLPGLDGGQLHEVMREANVELVDLSIVYRDTDLRPKKTDCAIERTNRERHGLLVRATGPPGISAQSTAQPRTRANVPEPVRRDWMREWKELAARFERLPTICSASLETNRNKNQTTYELWTINDDNNGSCRTLCEYAGRLLVKSPNALKRASEHTQQQSAHVERWLYFLKDNRCISQNPYGGLPPIGEDGTIYFLETVRELASTSARICLECAAYEL